MQNASGTQVSDDEEFSMDIDFMFSFRFLQNGDTIISECLKIVVHRTLNIVQRQTFQCHWVVGAVTGCHWIVIGVSIVNGSHYLPLPQDKIGVSHLAKTNRIYSE